MTRKGEPEVVPPPELKGYVKPTASRAWALCWDNLAHGRWVLRAVFIKHLQHAHPYDRAAMGKLLLAAVHAGFLEIEMRDGRQWIRRPGITTRAEGNLGGEVKALREALKNSGFEANPDGVSRDLILQYLRAAGVVFVPSNAAMSMFLDRIRPKPKEVISERVLQVSSPTVSRKTPWGNRSSNSVSSRLNRQRNTTKEHPDEV